MNKNNDKLEILIFEDDVVNQKVYNILLSKSFTLSLFSSFDEYIKGNENKNYDAVIMDLGLPGSKDGIEITKYLRDLPNFKNIPIIGVSAYAFLKDEKNALNAGMNIFIKKPFNSDTLIKIIYALKDEKKSN